MPGCMKHVWSDLSSQSWALISSFFQECKQINRCAFRTGVGQALGRGRGGGRVLDKTQSLLCSQSQGALACKSPLHPL